MYTRDVFDGRLSCFHVSLTFAGCHGYRHAGRLSHYLLVLCVRFYSIKHCHLTSHIIIGDDTFWTSVNEVLSPGGEDTQIKISLLSTEWCVNIRNNYKMSQEMAITLRVERPFIGQKQVAKGQQWNRDWWRILRNTWRHSSNDIMLTMTSWHVSNIKDYVIEINLSYILW